MTLSTTTNRVEYTGDGSTTAFAVNFYFLANADLKVYQAGTLKTITTHYTVSGAGVEAGGTVTFLTAPANGEAVIILRDPAITQTTDYPPNDPFPAASHERALDKLTMVAQRLDDRLDRAAVLPDTVASSVTPTLPTPSANAVLVWNSGATGLTNGPTTTEIADAEANAVAAAASASAASTSETNAASSESAAAASAAAAVAAAASVIWNDVVFITSADSPYSITSSHRGKMVAVDCSSGAVSITLPQISGLSLASPYVVGIKKTDGSGNSVTISRSGTDTIDGATSKIIGTADSGAVFIPDTGPSPDEWTTAEFGATAGNMTDEVFTDGVGFTAGVSTTLTLSQSYGSETNIAVHFDAAFQGPDTYSLSGTTLTFSSAIPGGVGKVYVKGGTTLSIGTPSDGTVTAAKMAYSAVNGQTAETSPATDDELLIADTSEGALNKMTFANLLNVVNSLTEDTTPDKSADFVLSYDASAGSAKKVKVTNLGISLGTVQTTTSGTAKDFTIPAGTKRIRVMLNGVSTNGGAYPAIQLGDAGGVETSSYNGLVGSTAFSNYFQLTANSAAGYVYYGSVTLELSDSATNTWTLTGGVSHSGGTYEGPNGYKALSDTITQLRFTTSNGTDVFDLGSVNVNCE